MLESKLKEVRKMEIERMRKIEARVKFFLLGMVLVLVASCSDDEPETQNEYVNKWILQEMQTFYLWNEEMPSPKKNQSPEVFFDKLLSDDDRFSWIQENYIELLNSLQGINKEAGCETTFYGVTNSNDVIGHIKYIKSNSPAEEAGLKRGDIINEINGVALTRDNASTLIGEMNKSYSIRYMRYNEANTAWEDQGSITLEPIEYAENPNYLNDVFTLGDHKIGYYVYNFFAPGTNPNPLQYNTEMDQIFAHFKSSNITDLILDLRYNSGGSETATIKLASLIGTNVDASKVFVNREYNDLITEYYKNDTDLFKTNFTVETNNIGTQLGGKVYVITSSERTASASELLINGLRPYMDVVLVGGVTIGKNVGSISLYEENDSKNTWGIQPIVVKSYNSNFESNYSEGFIPDVAIDENDNDLILQPLGDLNEPLLSKTVEQITGIAARMPQQAKAKRNVSEIAISILKQGRFNLVIDNKHVVEQLRRKLQTEVEQMP